MPGAQQRVAVVDQRVRVARVERNRASIALDGPGMITLAAERDSQLLYASA